MTGWLAFALLAVVAFGIAWLVGQLDRAAAMLVASALFVAAAGYVWQGSPGLPGAPVADTVQQGLKRDTLFAQERVTLLSPYGEAGQWLVFADGLNRAGEDQAAVSVLEGAVAKFPKDVALRLGFAHALLVLADYRLTPAVMLAYDRAAATAPADPAPRYFAALARLESGDFAGAERDWRALDRGLPAASPWHKVLRARLALFDRMQGNKPPSAG